VHAPFRSVRHLTALDRVSFDVMTGECFGVIGPNGAGKTTLFRILAAAMPPDAGVVEIAGSSLLQRDNSNRVRGLVGSVLASDRTLYWRLSARENLRLYAALHGIPARPAQERISLLLRIVGLDEARSRMVGQFSTGMKQRLLIARALLPQPRVLLLDEPTRSLDPIAAREFREFIRSDVMAATNCTVLVATHNDEEAFDLCDRVAFLDKGRVLAVGRMADLVGRYGDATYEILTRTPGAPVFSLLRAQRRLSTAAVSAPDGEGWFTVALTIQGTSDDAAEVLHIVTAAGVGIRRFARVPPTLADLIRLVQNQSHSEGVC